MLLSVHWRDTCVQNVCRARLACAEFHESPRGSAVRPVFARALKLGIVCGSLRLGYCLIIFDISKNLLRREFIVSPCKGKIVLDME